MDDDTRPIKVYKMVLLFEDHDELGPEETKDLLENARYPNHIIGPTVMSTETREVMWNDDHPLNHTDSQAEAFELLFGKVTRDEEMDRLRKERDDAVAEAAGAYRLFPPLLKGVCDALKGVPAPEALVSYDWSDLPAVAARVVSERDAALAEVARLSGSPKVYHVRLVHDGLGFVVVELRRSGSDVALWEFRFQLEGIFRNAFTWFAKRWM